MKICEICKKTISEDEVFGVDGHENVCFECAEAKALKAKEEKREIQITHGEFAEAWSLCLNPLSLTSRQNPNATGNTHLPVHAEPRSMRNLPQCIGKARYISRWSSRKM